MAHSSAGPGSSQKGRLSSRCCLAEKLAWRDTRLLGLFTDYLGHVIHPLSVAVCTDFTAWSCFSKQVLKIGRSFVQRFVHAVFCSKRKGLKSVGISWESVWDKYSLLIIEEKKMLLEANGSAFVRFSWGWFKLYWIHMQWVWLYLIVPQAVWDEHKDDTNRRMASYEGCKNQSSSTHKKALLILHLRAP